MSAALVLLFATTAAAGTITIGWDPSPEPTVRGYIVYVGTSAGSYTASYDVGNVTAFDFTSAAPNTTYHFAVRAYASSSVMSPLSANLAASVLALPAAPTHLTLSNPVTITPTFSWSAVAHADTYFLWVDDAKQAGKIRQIYSAAQLGCGSGTGTCSIAPGVTLAAGTANWKVLAANSAGDGPWSAGSPFTVTAPVTTPPPDSAAVTLLSRNGWRLRYVDSQESVGYPAKHAFDGDRRTLWATQWVKNAPAPPHELQIDVRHAYPIAGIRYLPRQDQLTDGNIGRYEVYVSTDGVNWGAPVATGTFATGSAEQQVLFPAKTGRFIRLRALSEVSGGPLTVVAEFNVLTQK